MAAKKQQEVLEATRERTPWEQVRSHVFTTQRARLQGKDLTDEQKDARARSYAHQAVGDVWLALSAAGFRLFPNVPVCHECQSAIHAAAELRAPEIQALANQQWATNQARGEAYRAELAARS